VKPYDANQLLDYFCQQLPPLDVDNGARQSNKKNDQACQSSIAICIDSLVAGVHFPQQTPALWVAQKALAVNLSDLAAMGAKPQSIVLGLVIPVWDENWLEEFCSGLQPLFEQWALQLTACDVCSGPLSVTIQAQGEVCHAVGLQRSGAKSGDLIYVTGSLGDAACALSYYYKDTPLPPGQRNFLQQRLNYPEPRIKAGLAIVDIASAAIDVSDGLAADLGHILEESAVGAIVHVEQLPASEALTALTDENECLQLQLAGGDDYELCFTIPVHNEQALLERFSELDVTCSRIGEIVAGSELEFFKGAQKINLSITGYDHFAGAKQEK